MVARAIHQRSRRSRRSLVKVNCGSIPRELFESEFFGHVRGSFTGAVRDRTGRFQLADGGTLFLDEVGEIPLDLQVKLLRVLQEGEFERVGDDATRHVDVRVVAATNRDLQKEVAEHRFRLDLFYRLGVFPISVPPLRARRDDIPDLIAHFVRQSCARLHVDVPRLPLRELDRARAYDWPGNVRELQNIVERAVILARGGTLALPLPEAGPESLVESASTETLEPMEIVPERRWRDLERANVLRAEEGGVPHVRAGRCCRTSGHQRRNAGVETEEARHPSPRPQEDVEAPLGFRLWALGFRLWALGPGHERSRFCEPRAEIATIG